MNKKTLTLMLLFCLALFAIKPAFADCLIGKRCSDIYVKKWVNNRPIDKQELDGAVCLIEFWATWCGPCVRSVDHLNELNNKYRNEGLMLISISSDRDEKKLTSFVDRKNINYYVGIDNGTADLYQVKAYPTLFMVDHKGIVRWKGHPWSDDLESELQKALDEAGPAVLRGMPLGPFEYLEENLQGGTDFRKAYNELKAYADQQGDRSPEKIAAERIVKRIDSQIMNFADRLKHNTQLEPPQLIDATYKIIQKYPGADATMHLIEYYRQLREKYEKKNTSADSSPANDDGCC